MPISGRSSVLSSRREESIMGSYEQGKCTRLSCLSRPLPCGNRGDIAQPSFRPTAFLRNPEILTPCSSFRWHGASDAAIFVDPFLGGSQIAECKSEVFEP